MLDSDVIINKQFEFKFTGHLRFWHVQQYEWAKLLGKKDILRHWGTYTNYNFRDIVVEVEPSRQYTVTAIKRFPKDWLFRAEWLGDIEKKSSTNVLHIPTAGMLIKFDGQEVLKVGTLCSNTLQVAVRDTIHTRTRICKVCDRSQQARERDEARRAKGPFNCTMCGMSDHFPIECLTHPDPNMMRRIKAGEVTAKDRRQGYKELV